MICTLGWAAVAGASLSFIYGNMETGRMELANGSFKDPNEYALTLLMGLPLVALMARSGNRFLRFVAVGCTPATVVVFLHAGSRGGMIALLGMGRVLLWGVSLSKKVIVLIGAVAALVVGSAILPDYLQQRYLTFFTADDSGLTNVQDRAVLEGADVASTEGRFTLLIASLKMTAKHPLFGVGPGNFPTEYWSESKDEGKHVAWNVTHNTYTQLSSETGIPGALLFIAFLYRAFQAAGRGVRVGAANGYPELARAAYHLWLSLTGVCVGAFFLSLAYSPIFYVLGAIALSLERAISQPKAAMARPLAPPVATPVAAGVGLPASSGKRVMSGKAVRALMRKV
jgi:O-antigen ligase